MLSLDLPVSSAKTNAIRTSPPSFRMTTRYFHGSPSMLGVRYEIFGPPSEVNGRLPTFDPTIATPDAPPSGTLSGFVLPANYEGTLPPGVIKSPHDGLWATNYNDVSPRIGFAARMPNNPSIVLRGGYGIYFDRMSGDLAEQSVGQPPFSFKQSLAGRSKWRSDTAGAL